MRTNIFYLFTTIFVLLITGSQFAQNPIIRNQFSADPSARVFGDKVYLYPSHDIRSSEGKGRPDWFCMEDYHVFSSENLTDWTDHGVIISQDKVPWGNAKAFSMWAPDCVFKNGKYYFFFPDPAGDTTLGRGFSIGVAIADKPEGPFVPEAKPIKNARGIDPNPFIDKDGQAYLYWAMGRIAVAKLKDNMVELASEPKTIQGLPEKGLKEGPYMFERNGIYYLTYPHVDKVTERLEYAMSSSPMGPFKVAGVIMDETPECWTNHQSVIQYKNQWYLFYHHNDLSPHFDKNRSVRIDSLSFNEDGTIKKVIPTLRGVGITDATQKIQIDRYSAISEKGASVDFIDTLKKFDGWKTMLTGENAWIKYNSVDFGNDNLKSVVVNALSKTGGTIELRADKVDGPVIASVEIPKQNEWAVVVNSSLKESLKGIHHLVVILKDNTDVDIDWVSFK